eukprot:TRINITY_DN21041_c0_g1_i1.p1 TRINITY_DN21041_c0_g1~~TRINITY_DN21041_c0_g1_i1.p1  ORF type:complete len:402 (+),score=143.31 TRINITY_DN21041_c0_g1_i1:211-1416(+)
MLRFAVLLVGAVAVAGLTTEDRDAALLQDIGAPIDSTVSLVYCRRHWQCRLFGDSDGDCDFETNRCKCGSDFTGVFCRAKSSPLVKIRLALIAYFKEGLCSKVGPESTGYSLMSRAVAQSLPAGAQDFLKLDNFCGSIVTSAQVQISSDDSILESSIELASDAIVTAADETDAATPSDPAFRYAKGDTIEITVMPLFEQEGTATLDFSNGCSDHAMDSWEAPSGNCYVLNCKNGYSQQIDTTTGNAETHRCEANVVVPGRTQPGAIAENITGGALTDLQLAAIVIGGLVLVSLLVFLTWFFLYRAHNDEDDESQRKSVLNDPYAVNEKTNTSEELNTTPSTLQQDPYAMPYQPNNPYGEEEGYYHSPYGETHDHLPACMQDDSEGYGHYPQPQPYGQRIDL